LRKQVEELLDTSNLENSVENPTQKTGIPIRAKNPAGNEEAILETGARDEWVVVDLNEDNESEGGI
jgi:hypothetical protein